MNNRGILLIALGHPAYGDMACNLAASIRVNSPDLPIHLVWADQALSHLSEEKKRLFSSMEECPHDYYHRGSGKKVYIKAKTHIYDLTPFDETIFLDVDTILTPKKSLSGFFDDLSPLIFTMENRGRVNLAEIRPTDTYLWAEIPDITSAFKLTEGYLYGLHSEFIYWKQIPEMEGFFKTVKEIFAQPLIPMKHVFNGDIPDEFAFAMAMLKHGIYPHTCPFIPLFWHLTDKHLGSTLQYVIDNYYGYSVGGNATPEAVCRNYDRLANGYFYRLGLQHPYRLRPKRSIMAERKLM